jgi:hypothetical protein
MDQFIMKHRDEIAGVLSGFDRIVFRGWLRSLSYPEGMKGYLWANQVRLVDFGTHAHEVSERVKAAVRAQAAEMGRPEHYLTSADEDKETLARAIAARDGIDEGLVCLLSCVEPCQTFEIYRNRELHRLQLVARRRKCLFLYQYWMDPEFGFLHARIQTWFPFAMQIWMNGREWLARQMDRAGLRYVRHDNCFPWVADWARAQRLLDAHRHTSWPRRLDRIARRLNPVHREIFRAFPARYYWTMHQTEWAIDIAFRRAAVLRRLFPHLLHYALTVLHSQDILRYLGRPVRRDGEVPKNFRGEVTTDLKVREEGVRVKHTVDGNSVKLYDKAFTAVGSVLRAEATRQRTDGYRVYRRKEGDQTGPKTWRVLRRGVADASRRAAVSERAVERYLDALAWVEDQTTVQDLLARLGQPRDWKGRRVRALDPLHKDRALLDAVSRGEFTLNGFRNRDLQRIFFGAPADEEREKRRRSAWVSRKLRLLRAHGVIRKVTGTYRYQLTEPGQRAVGAISAALRATVCDLLPKAS